jgi:chromosomal replication initiator protein
MKAWDDFLQKMEERLGKNTIQQWVRPLRIVKFDARNLYLESNDPLQVAWFEEHLRPHLKSGLFNNNDRPIQVFLALSQSGGAKPSIEPPKNTYSILPDRLDPEFTFDHFVTSSDNMVAYKLLKDPQGLNFNPIYLYGSKHTGKTHLLTATAHYYQAKGKKVFFVRAETFTSHVVQAIRLGLMLQFRSIYRNIDVLIIDDIDFLAKKDATQEEFFHTFNALHTSGKQILLSASIPPSQLNDIEQRLISRFEWGISIKVGDGDPLSILKQKAKLWKLSFSPEIFDFLSKTFPQDPLIALQALSIRTKGMSSLTPEKAETLLQDLIDKNQITQITAETIAEESAAYFGIKKEDILGKSQSREYAYPRQIAMFLCREKLKLAYQKIGEIFGRDHSTVMSSVRQIQKNSEEKESPLLNDLKSIEQRLQKK